MAVGASEAGGRRTGKQSLPWPASFSTISHALSCLPPGQQALLFHLISKAIELNSEGHLTPKPCSKFHSPHCLLFHLGNKLSCSTLLPTLLNNLFFESFIDADVGRAVVADLKAVRIHDPFCLSYSHCLLYYKGFLAFQAHRVTRRFWLQDRTSLPPPLQYRISDVFAVNIHPGACISSGVLLDHVTGIVIGETSVIGNNVSLLHHVTLGGTGKRVGDRHPKIENGVLIGAAATLVENVKIGEGAKIGPGSVVLNDVPSWTTAMGSPAKLVGKNRNSVSHSDPPGESMDHTSSVVRWSESETR